jgi:hypothetical protein
MDALIGELQSQASTVANNVGTAAVAGVGVGIVIYGIRKVWRAFKSM